MNIFFYFRPPGQKRNVFLFLKISISKVWIAAFHKMSRFNFVQKLLQFQVQKSGRISQKFYLQKMKFMTSHAKWLTPLSLVQNCWNFLQMNKTSRGTKVKEYFWEILQISNSENGPKNDKFIISRLICVLKLA